MQNRDLWVDNAAHLLYLGGRVFPCDRDIESLAAWNDHALLLSSDTDCLSLWDGDGPIRTTRVGVYPQDMAVQGDTAYVCGGADGQLHLLNLPDLGESAAHHLPGMPERVCIRRHSAHLLTLLADVDVETALLTLDLSAGEYVEVARFAGLPGAIAADENGLWVGVSEQVLHLPYDAGEADLVIDGFGLARRIDIQENGALVTDPVQEIVARVMQKNRPAIEVLYRGEVGQIVFS